MNAARRIIAVIMGLAFIAVGVLLAACLINESVFNYWTRIAVSIFSSGMYTFYIGITAAAFIVLGAFSFFAGIARKHTAKMAKVSGVDGVAVNVSLTAIDTIVRKAASQVDHVKDVKCKLKPVGDSVEVELSVTIPANISVPETAAQLKSSVKNALENMTGLKVSAVKVLINSVNGEEVKKMTVVAKDQGIVLPSSATQEEESQ